jgi:hypothetical protein
MDTSSVGEIDEWIEKLYNCKPLSEQEIKRLCEKVRACESSIFACQNEAPFAGGFAPSTVPPMP